VRSGIVWLDAWGEAGEPEETPARGLRIPTEVAAVHPATYRSFVPASERPAIAGLDGGHALLGSTAAAIRGVETGGSLTMGDRTLAVDGVIDDGLVGAHEVVVSYETGRALGVVTPRYLLVAPGPEADHRKVEAGLRRVVPAGVRLRVRAPGETPVFRQGDAVLPQVRIKELFGEFAAEPQPDGTIRIDPAWTRENIVEARVPILRGAVVCHRLILPQLRAALRELVRKGLGDLIDPGDYGGCYSPRFANFDTGAGLSHHAWGVAIDFNVSRNLLGDQPSLDPRVVEVFRDAGFQWGGQFLVPDGMHFEFLEFPD
ncbi:MAG: M15 family metallopeptidase, partial [Actinomycetota bacterium]